MTATAQHPGQYTADDHATWATLVRTRMTTLGHTAADEVLTGIEAIGLTPGRVPMLSELNARLTPRTGWQVVPVTGYLNPREFFSFLADRRFPSTTHVRPADQLEYIPSPDIFHDVFGHVPLHADPTFAELLQRFGLIGCRTTSDNAMEAVQRLFWFTVEFGLVGSVDNARIYGSGLVSSIAEERHALGGTCTLRPFVLETVLQQSFEVDVVQPTLFVLPHFRALRDAVDHLAAQLPGPDTPMIS